MSEFQILAKLSFPNIIRLVYVNPHGKLATYRGEEEEVSHLMYIATELCYGRDIFGEIKTQGAFSEAKALDVILPVMKAVEYMHSQGYAHMDVKADNIMRDLDDNIVLLDFSCAMSCSEKQTAALGTEGRQPPELLKGE